VLHDLQGLGNLTSIMCDLSDTWDKLLNQKKDRLYAETLTYIIAGGIKNI
jgi:hypothetical protein